MRSFHLTFLFQIPVDYREDLLRFESIRFQLKRIENNGDKYTYLYRVVHCYKLMGIVALELANILLAGKFEVDWQVPTLVEWKTMIGAPSMLNLAKCATKVEVLKHLTGAMLSTTSCGRL